MSRPQPPSQLLDLSAEKFTASPEIAGWIRETFVEEGATLQNPEHGHLQEASIGVLWTNVPNARQGKQIVGQAEPGDPVGAMGKWAKARARLQVETWFGDIPDFIITLDAHHAASCSDDEFCALIEHELYHCAQEIDPFGMPKFRKDGRPSFAIRGHDVEEFIGVVRRYGASAAGVSALVEAANKRPEIAAVSIAHACGTCLRMAA